MTSALETGTDVRRLPIPTGLRILYLANGFPWPLTSGYLRHYFMIRELARRGHRVSLLTIVPTGFAPEDRAALEPFTERIVTVDSHRRTRSLRRRAQRRLGIDLDRRERRPATARRGRGPRSPTVPHDVVLFSGKRTYPALDAVGRAADRRRRVRRDVEPAARQPALCVDRAACRCSSPSTSRSAGSSGPSCAGAVRVLFASVRDRDALLEPSERDRATILPNGVDLDVLASGPAGTPLGRDEIVFTGAMDYPPNTDAALFLIREILPRVRAEVSRPPTCRSSGATRLGAHQGRAGRPGVTVTGLVDDVRPYLTSRRACSPRRSGSEPASRTRSSRRWRWASRPWPARTARPA